LIVEGIEPSDYPTPSGLALRALNDNNFTIKYARKNTQANLDLALYNPSFRGYTGSLNFDLGSLSQLDSTFYAVGDQSPLLAYSEKNKSFSGNFALFFQQLSIKAENKTRFRYFTLSPSGPSAPNTKTVNRVFFSQDKLKLRIYYTKPTTPLN
jgi:hypothetical protein